MAYRTSAKGSLNSTGTLTVTPAGVTAHDYLCGVVNTDTTTDALTGPTGWTLEDSVFNVAPDGQRFYLFDFKDAVGGGGDNFDFTSVAFKSAITVALSGRNNTTPLSATPVQTTNTSSNTSPISASLSGITASAADDILAFCMTDQNTATDRWTFTQITGYTERQDGVNADWISGVMLNTLDNTSAGATGSLATTISRTGTGNAGYTGWVLAIKAAGGGPVYPPQLLTMGVG